MHACACERVCECACVSACVCDDDEVEGGPAVGEEVEEPVGEEVDAELGREDEGEAQVDGVERLLQGGQRAVGVGELLALQLRLDDCDAEVLQRACRSGGGVERARGAKFMRTAMIRKEAMPWNGDELYNALTRSCIRLHIGRASALRTAALLKLGITIVREDSVASESA